MSVQHLFGSEDWYLIHVNHGKDERRPKWQHRKVYLHGPNTEASIAWNLFGRHGFGFGWQLGINGSESDIGLDIYLGRFLSVWMRFRAPFTKWLQLDSEKHGYDARHFGVRLFNVSYLRIECFNTANGWSRSQPWWYEVKINKTTIWGRKRSETTVLDSGVCRVPMPEGNYVGTWRKKLYESRYVRWPGTWRDKVSPKSHILFDLDIPGCIPVQGKGENSWDLGMSGVCGTSGRTLEDAIGNATKSALRDRARYGGPHDLDRPMTISEAEAQ